MGIICNDYFVHVSKTHMENYVYLKIICIITSCIPLSYMWCLIPSKKDIDELLTSNVQEELEVKEGAG